MTRKSSCVNARGIPPAAWPYQFLAIPGRGGGGSLDKNFFFPVWTCIKPNLVSKKFPFTKERGGPLAKKIFFQSEHVSSQIWCQKNFPLLRRGGPSVKKNFLQSEHVSSQIWCQKNFPLLGGRSLDKKFFFQFENVSSQIWCQKNFPIIRRREGSLGKKIFFAV